jgi:hypothetical protein
MEHIILEKPAVVQLVKKFPKTLLNPNVQYGVYKSPIHNLQS